MKHVAAWSAACSLSALAALPAQTQPSASLEVTGALDQRLVDTDGDGACELVVICRDRIARYRPDAGGWRADGEVSLADPAHSLVAIEDMLATPGRELILLDRQRTACLPWDGAPPVVLARRGRSTVRVDNPQFAPFVIDLNEDGKLDLMIPGLGGVTPYFQARPGEDGAPGFVRLPPVRVPTRVRVDPGSSGLDQELVGSVRIPQIRVVDLNADGRPDMLTRDGGVRAFHMQRTDGSFAPPIEVDIEQFVDSTPKAAVDFGRTAVLSDAQQLQRGDIDGDGVADFVVAHRRKLWTFLGAESGPQFTEARTQAVADDVTALRMMDLDEDGKDDLLTFRVQVPDLATVVLGLVRATDVDIRAVGYESRGDGFAKKPRWRRTVTLRVPPLLSLLGRQEELIERFTNIVNEARVSTRGVFTAEDQEDLVLVRTDDHVADLFPGVPRAPKLETADGIRLLRRLLFEDEDTVFDLERVFGLMSGFVSQMSEQLEEPREPAASLRLRDPAAWRLVVLEAAQLDDQRGEELVVGYESVSGERVRAFDLVRWRP